MKRVLWFASLLFPWGLLVGAILAALLGCAAAVTRLGPGDCAVLRERDQIITVGNGCAIQRIYTR
jgi:hypothetical protein